MSTRSTTHFCHQDGAVEAIIYRHTDGYPEVAGADLLAFIERTGRLVDSRHGDAAYLAAKYVVYLAEKFAVDYRTGKPRSERLDFISVGVVSQDPSDIEYRYVVRCGFPLSVTCYTREEREWRKLIWPSVQSGKG